VIFLLDVNALVALGFQRHEFHDQLASWDRMRQPRLATCSITELGFVRILTQTPIYDLTITQARGLLVRFKETVAPRLTFINDNHDISHLPGWVRAPKQITDGHLARLANENGTVLATLDKRIPGSFLIPL